MLHKIYLNFGMSNRYVILYISNYNFMCRFSLVSLDNRTKVSASTSPRKCTQQFITTKRVLRACLARYYRIGI